MMPISTKLEKLLARFKKEKDAMEDYSNMYSICHTSDEHTAMSNLISNLLSAANCKINTFDDLKTALIDLHEAYKQYKFALNTHNRLLGKLSELVNCDCKITSYTSRHSWATAARNHNVPISVISQGMGHTSLLTTQIYLSMLENSVIDDANKEIIECIE